MNNVKEVIQKEEYISLAINKYILQTAKIPKKSDGSNDLDWEKLLTEDYLGANFNKTNPLTSKDIVVNFDSNNNAFIKGVIESEAKYKEEHNYLYNFYINKVFRVNTIPPSNITKEKLYLGSEVLYNNTQKEIIKILNETNHKDIKLSNQTCVADDYFYELKNEKLTYKFCRADYSFDVYQESPIYLEKGTTPLKDLEKVIANIGDKAFIKDGSSWYEYYYQGGDASSAKWIASGMGNALTSVDDTINIEDRILSYIPDSKDLVLRRDGGCMLANGDIFCWGNNQYKKAGIESYGQLDTSLKPDYVNTPVMLKVQIDNIEVNNETLDLITKKWYNNPYRVKFEKMAMNNKFICGISPIFDYYEAGIRYKLGGDLYCNGYIHSDYFQTDNTGQIETSILRKNKIVATGKENRIYNSSAIYLKDIVMVDGTWILLSDTGTLYSVGSNEKGALGIGSTDQTIYTYTPQIINPSGVLFKKIYALRDIKGFGALDSQNYFWIWGERASGKIWTKPIVLSNSYKFNENAIFVNSQDFVLKRVDNKYLRTYSDLSVKELNIPSSALSVSIYDIDTTEHVVYIDENMQLQGSLDFLNCRDNNFNTCTSSENTIFSTAFTELNTKNNIVNNREYANFSNISIFKSTINKSIVNYGEDYLENFEDGLTTGWNLNYIHDGGLTATKFLGRLGKGRIDTDQSKDGIQQVYKTIDLGTVNANANVKITFDMYEIDSWDANQYSGDNLNGKTESFYVYINDLNVSKDIYAVDSSYTGLDTKDGINLGNILNTEGYEDEKHTYSFVTTLDANGKVKLGFGAILGEDYTNESFGIDNIKISKKIDNATFTGGIYLENFENQSSEHWIVPNGPVPYTATTDPFYNYPIYIDSGLATKFLGRFGKKQYSGKIYHGKNDGTEEVYKVFSFGSENANKEVNIEYDFYRIDDWDIGQDYFYVFINNLKKEKFREDLTNLLGINLYGIDNTNILYGDYKYHFSDKVYLDAFGNVRLGFGSYFQYDYMQDISWGVDNIKFTLTGNTNPSADTTTTDTSTSAIPYICAMTGFGSASQMYCWGNVGRSIPILSTSLYDMSKIDSINKLFISQESEKTKQMSFTNFDNNGNLFLRYPTYIGGFDYPFYFK